jgi:AAA domain
MGKVEEIFAMSISGGNIELEPDRDQIEIFIDAMFRHARKGGFVSLRSFIENKNQPFVNAAARIGDTLHLVIKEAINNARVCANHPEGVVFCPPIATFNNRTRARGKDVDQGLTLSVECDQRPNLARQTLERILGPATIVVASGGRWIDPTTRETEDKLHLHWRLSKPATGDTLKALEEARDIACRIVDGDPTSKAVCHPIRWPGSWHRKSEPVLCRIESANPDREIDLAVALTALTAACPGHAKPNSNGKNFGERTDWAGAIAGIISGEDYHHALVVLAAKLIATGMGDGAVVNLLRGLMEASGAPRDERWRARYDDIPRAVRTAREKFGAGQMDSPPQTPSPQSGIGQKSDGLRAESSARSAAFDPPPYAFPDPAKIPPRQWLYGRHYMRGVVSVTLGAPGRLKSTTLLAEFIGMSAGIDLLSGKALECGPLRVAYFNGEETQKELDRRVAGIMQRYRLSPEQCEGRLWISSTLEESLRFAVLNQKGQPIIADETVNEILVWCERQLIDALSFDPLVSFHSVRESDAGDMDLLYREGFDASQARNAAPSTWPSIRASSPSARSTPQWPTCAAAAPRKRRCALAGCSTS